MIPYELEVAKPGSHLARIIVRVERMSENTLHFKLPSWSPGSYRIRDYSGEVVKAEAKDENGRPLPIKKTDKQTWRVELQDAKTALFSYEVYCHEIGTQASFIDSDHA